MNNHDPNSSPPVGRGRPYEDDRLMAAPSHKAQLCKAQFCRKFRIVNCGLWIENTRNQNSESENRNFCGAPWDVSVAPITSPLSRNHETARNPKFEIKTRPLPHIPTHRLLYYRVAHIRRPWCNERVAEIHRDGKTGRSMSQVTGIIARVKSAIWIAKNVSWKSDRRGQRSIRVIRIPLSAW